jgi:hypothetical protein
VSWPGDESSWSTGGVWIRFVAGGAPVERENGDDVARAHAALRKAGDQHPDATHELRAGQPARAGHGDGGAAAAGQDAAEAMRDVALAVLRHRAHGV